MKRDVDPFEDFTSGARPFSMRHMRAVRIHGDGGPEMLRVEEVPIPTPGAGQVLVRIVASGVNPLDCQVHEGLLKEFAPLSLPRTLGSDLSGVVADAGPGTSRFSRGDAVTGACKLSSGTFAEYAAVAESDLIAKPRRVSHFEAAALPLSGLTAHAALTNQRGLRSGERVLILGGAGGVGHLAVQIAKNRGAWVTATASRSNLEFLRSLGADLAIDWNASDLQALLKPVDLVIDTVGAAALASAWQVLKPRGRVHSIVARASGPDCGKAIRDAVFVSARPNCAVLTQLAQLLDSGLLRLEIPHVYPLTQAVDALALSQSDHVRGKVVLSLCDLWS